jgi:hypothetical protein
MGWENWGDAKRRVTDGQGQESSSDNNQSKERQSLCQHRCMIFVFLKLQKIHLRANIPQTYMNGNNGETEGAEFDMWWHQFSVSLQAGWLDRGRGNA